MRVSKGWGALCGLVAGSLSVAIAATAVIHPVWAGSGAWFEGPLLVAAWSLLAGLAGLQLPGVRHAMEAPAQRVVLRLVGIVLLAVVGGCVGGLLLQGGHGETQLERWMDGPLPLAVLLGAAGAAGLAVMAGRKPYAAARSRAIDRATLCFCALAPLAFVWALVDVHMAGHLTVIGVVGMLGTPFLAAIAIALVASGSAGVMRAEVAAFR